MLLNKRNQYKPESPVINISNQAEEKDGTDYINIDEEEDDENQPKNEIAEKQPSKQIVLSKGVLIPHETKNQDPTPPNPVNIIIPRGNPVTPNQFLEWVKLSGIKMVNLNISLSDIHNSNKIKSPDTIKEGDNIIFVPKEYIVTSGHAMLSKICRGLDNIQEFSLTYDKICLTLYLLLDLPKHLETYINFLVSNTKFNSLPYYYTPTERLYLKGSYFEQLLLVKERLLYGEYDLLVTRGYLNPSICRDVYMTHRIVVMSRAFQLNLGRDKVSAFAPLIDLVPSNSRKSNSSVYFDEAENVVLKSPMEIKPTTLINTTYNRYSNYYNLLSYGFIEESAVPIEIFLDLGIGNKVIEELSLSSNMRINSLLKKIRRSIQEQTVDVRAHKNPAFPISIENELESIRLLKTAIGQQMRATSKCNEDLPSEGYNYKNMKVVLVEEDKVIIYIILAAENLS
jgi:hypothetical protein